MATGTQIIRKLKDDVKSTFDEVRKALQMREKLLLRQIDAIATASQTQNNNPLTDEIKFIPEEELDILESIRSFGKFNLGHLNFASDVYANEDYICPTVDHETMYKCLDGRDEVDCSLKQDEEKEEIVVDFVNNKQLKENISNMNDSIINITLNETKELIDKTKGNSIPENVEQKVAQSSQTDLNINKLKKPNITINNCNGTINLKNISNLTINCTGQASIQAVNSEDSLKSEEDTDAVTTTSTTEDSQTKDNENNTVNCEFYNRLLMEIKNSLKQQTSKTNDNPPTGTRKSVSEMLQNCSSTDTNSNESYNRKLLLKNFENLKIVLENNENDTHPVQIEQWLTEIISDTEIEPMQNTAILEHSKLSGKELY